MSKQRVGLALVMVLAQACLVPKGAGGDAGGTGSGGAGGGAGDGGLPVTGSGCVQDPVTNVPLCAAVSSCPDVAVDPEAFPNCGFRVHCWAASWDSASA